MSERKPLTLEELRCMANKPYWHVGLRGAPHWCILDPILANHPEDYDYGETWLAYAHEPLRFDRSEWKCGICEVPTHWSEWGEMGYEYCPHCGRPLTEAAWKMLEKRLENGKEIAHSHRT